MLLLSSHLVAQPLGQWVLLVQEEFASLISEVSATWNKNIKKQLMNHLQAKGESRKHTFRMRMVHKHIETTFNIICLDLHIPQAE